jgi:hypothetical protein
VGEGFEGPKWTSDRLRERGFITRGTGEVMHFPPSLVVLTEAEDRFASEITA